MAEVCGLILTEPVVFRFSVVTRYNTSHGQARSHGEHSEAVRPNLFMPHTFCCTQKNLFQKYNKIKNLTPLKMYFAAPNLKTWLRVMNDYIYCFRSFQFLES